MEPQNMEILMMLGKYTREIRADVSKIIKVGQDITEIIDFIENKIFEKGYLPSFPAMVSINDMAAHYTVYDEGYILKNGDVIKVDFGVSSEGFITDNAFTVEIGTNKHSKLIETAKACLDAAMEKVDFQVTMSDIGKVVNNIAKEAGFNSVHNLTGHQIARNDLHCGLSVPNYENNDGAMVKNNMQLAIEPFITYGQPLIKAVRGSNILQLKSESPIRDPIAMKILKHIRENFPKLPFSKRWLINEVLKNNLKSKTTFSGFDKRKVNYAIRILKKHNIIYEYDELGTIDGEIVAQFEDCVVFQDNKKTIITRLKD